MARRYDYDYGGFPAYVSVGERKAKAEKQIAALAKKGQKLAPVRLDKGAIARTFWGKAWCTNLESYSDYENRLPRGRSYVRSGAVIDLQIAEGSVKAMVQGSSLYKVSVTTKPLAAARWVAIKAECAGKIDSMVSLLQGKIGAPVMAIVTDHARGLFPSPAEIDLSCSCPDGAYMCKHVAAALYGVGARLDEKPELFFVLRKVNPMDLLGTPLAVSAARPKKAIATAELGSIFGIELDDEPEPPKKKPAARKTAKAKATT